MKAADARTGWGAITLALALIVLILLLGVFASCSNDGSGTGSASSGTATPTTGSGAGGSVVTTDNLYVRLTPNTEQAPVGLIPAGASAPAQCWTSGQLINGQDRWIRVTWGGRTGYVSGFYTDTRSAAVEQLRDTWGLSSC